MSACIHLFKRTRGIGLIYSGFVLCSLSHSGELRLVSWPAGVGQSSSKKSRLHICFYLPQAQRIFHLQNRTWIAGFEVERSPDCTSLPRLTEDFWGIKILWLFYSVCKSWSKHSSQSQKLKNLFAELNYVLRWKEWVQL